MPCWLGWGQVFRRAGPYGGFLGKRFDALTTECNPYRDKDTKPTTAGYPNIVRGQPILPDSVLPPELTLDRLHQRRGLLGQLDDELRRVERQPGLGQFDRTQQRAFSLLTSAQARAAFDLSTEDPRLLDRYGRTLFGHSTLIGRRLVEAGVRFVNVTWDLFWDRVQIDYDAWDTHTRNFVILRENKLPGLDQTFTALMEDLEVRGLLDETLVVVMSEMGRTPKINGNAGRDHWTHCYSILFAGAGIRGGTIHGASDAQAAYVKDLPTSTADICATIFECLGIDPEMTVMDRAGRPVPIANGGHAIREILS
jgi:membrane-anchored protein YejM (alkaline phosphatase superfamily)